MGTGTLLPTGGIQPYGKVLGITDVGYNILDFVGDMHMPGHGREMHFDSTGCIINGTYSSNELTEPFPSLDPYFFAIFQIIKYTDSNQRNSLVIELKKKDIGSKPGPLGRMLKIARACFKISGWIRRADGAVNFDKSGFDIETPDGVVLSENMKSYIQCRYGEGQYMFDSI